MPLDYTGCFVCRPFLTLTVAGATRSGGVYYADFDTAGGNFLTITATTTADDVAWAIAGPGGTNPQGGATPMRDDQYRLPLDDDRNVLNRGQRITVTCTPDGLAAQTIDIVVRPVVAQVDFVANHYAFQQGANWRATNLSTLVSAPQNYTANLAAVLAPATPAAATYNNDVRWSARYHNVFDWNYTLEDVGNPLQRGIRLNHTRTVYTKAKVSGNANWCAEAPLDIQAPAASSDLANNLQIRLHQFTFAGAGHFDVTQEDNTHFNLAYSANWTRGVAVTPQGYVADDNCTLQNAQIEVLVAPNANTAVDVRTTAYFLHENGNLTVVSDTQNHTFNNGAGGTQNVGDFDFGDVPNEVMHLDPLLVFWEVRNAGGGNWLPLAVTANKTFVTAAAQVAAATRGHLNNAAAGGTVYTYLSLLDMSCQAANGQQGANNVRDAIYGLFNPANPNAQARRVTPGAARGLQYWNGPNHGNPAQNLNRVHILRRNMFNEPYGNLSCCVWAQMLIAMWALHGKGDGRYTEVDAPTRFLVRNWDYNNHGNLDPANYTHTIRPAINNAPVAGAGDRAAPVNNGVAGQNNANPPDSFHNHFIVRDGLAGNFYDPSYGTPPLARDAWVYASVGGRRNDATGLAGFVDDHPGSANDIRPAANAVTLTDFATNTVIP